LAEAASGVNRVHGSCRLDYASARMKAPDPDDPSRAALRSLIRRVVVFFVAGIAVIAAFAIAWRLGAFAPPHP
jgi:hypothetical protein